MCVIKVKNASYDRYEELIMRREELKKECLFWSNEYTRVFGELVVAVFKEKLLCAKKQLSFLRPRLRRFSKSNWLQSETMLIPKHIIFRKT